MTRPDRPTATEMGYDRRANGRPRKVRPHVEPAFKSVERYQRLRYSTIDRYLATAHGSVEALELLEVLVGEQR